MLPLVCAILYRRLRRMGSPVRLFSPNSQHSSSAPALVVRTLVRRSTWFTCVRRSRSRFLRSGLQGRVEGQGPLSPLHGRTEDQVLQPILTVVYGLVFALWW